FTRKGKYRRGGFYLHVSPSEVFVGGRVWNPDKNDIQYIRNGIMSDPERLRRALSDKEVTRRFGTLSGDELKTAPKGVDRDHEDIDLLRKKQFTLTKRSEEHTSELQSRENIVCRPLLEKKRINLYPYIRRST